MHAVSSHPVRADGGDDCGARLGDADHDAVAAGELGDAAGQSFGGLDVGDRDDVLDPTVGQRLPDRVRGGLRRGGPVEADGVQSARGPVHQGAEQGVSVKNVIVIQGQ